MKQTKTTMSLKQALVLYVLYGIAAILWAQRIPELSRRWGVVRDAAVEVKSKLAGWTATSAIRMR
jgi:hypothetical protein